MSERDNIKTGERRTATILSECIDPEEMDALMTRVVAVFGVSELHEDYPARTVHSGKIAESEAVLQKIMRVAPDQLKRDDVEAARRLDEGCAAVPGGSDRVANFLSIRSYGKIQKALEERTE